MIYYHFIAQRGMEMRHVEYHNKKGFENLRDRMERAG
tara:strand:- start:314 stop:424 length:111 start_codon:yes stop_codon:yes gene_type:complete